jgi:peptidoglycan hydrolase-like protein with peptidoglycan-binding domain
MNGSTEVVHLRLPRLQKGGREPQETKRLQHILNTLGEDIDETGGYGDDTERAVKKFQKKKHLMEDGKVGEETWAALLTNWLSG